MLIKNKYGSKYLSPYWFTVLIIVAAGIAGMVYVFYGTPYDVRDMEAHILLNQVADCVSYAGRINTNFISDSQPIQKSEEEFLGICNLNFKTSEWEEEQYYTKVEIYKLEDMENPFLKINAGNNNWLSSCDLQENKEQRNLAQCDRDSFYSLDNASNQYIIKVLTVVRKTEKNVKL